MTFASQRCYDVNSPVLVAAFYKFVVFLDYQQRRSAIVECCARHHIKGMILLAPEGINGTIAGADEDVRAVLGFLRSDERFADLQHKESHASKQPFHRMKVRLKKEIVPMNRPDVSPTTMAGTYVKPSEWNKLITDPDVIVIDTRNDYEVALGTFAGAVDPNIRTFAELPAWVQRSRELLDGKNTTTGKKPKIAMFCTGGIRCEKSTAYLRAEGFDEVYHLEGGILRYLETVSAEESLWQGECFVFDERVSVGHGLTPGEHRLCRMCRYPLVDDYISSPLYENGVSCPRCHGTTSEAQKQSARERQRQCEIAESRNEMHVGATVPQR